MLRSDGCAAVVSHRRTGDRTIKSAVRYALVDVRAIPRSSRRPHGTALTSTWNAGRRAQAPNCRSAVRSRIGIATYQGHVDDTRLKKNHLLGCCAFAMLAAQAVVPHDSRVRTVVNGTLSLSLSPSLSSAKQCSARARHGLIPRTQRPRSGGRPQWQWPSQGHTGIARALVRAVCCLASRALPFASGLTASTRCDQRSGEHASLRTTARIMAPALPPHSELVHAVALFPRPEGC